MAISDDHAGFARAEQAYKAFVSDPAKPADTRRHLEAVLHRPRPTDDDSRALRSDDALRHGLTGWRAFFEAHIIEGGAAAALMAELVEAEAALFASRQTFAL